MKLHKKKFILNIKEFSRLSYFCKRGNYIIHNSGYQHKVINNEENYVPSLFPMGMGQIIYKEFYFFYQDWINNEEIKKQDIFLWDNVSRIEVELDKKELFFKKLVNLKNNFPRKIVFINKKEEEIFSITFTENGLLEKIINNSEEKLIIKKMEKDFWGNSLVPK